MRPEQGDGDLLAGPRPEQLGIETSGARMIEVQEGGATYGKASPVLPAAERPGAAAPRPPAYNGERAVPAVPDGQLFAATSGTDSDWVVKLIDVYPDETPRQPQMGDYQLMVSADIFHGRYRESCEHPKLIEAEAVCLIASRCRMRTTSSARAIG